ncbi:MAG: Signal recognition particle receptor subunit beta, a GTPase [uncultured Thiotrichaceae bacterium]|uniref:Signal recognition particle receptor subunit beta, a GTPase n=1 Tax=uncultured Thiotrichaceae bacterium TaxID=298394 RepID=A0A6S6SFX9_9GAMM|nr:MAG: Signal recognition particle receptor subunit beta, a GTPase [uncultured Thiotrichaceae bacterium]
MLSETGGNHSSGSMEKRQPIHLALLGFTDATEQERISALFAYSHRWQQPWKIVDNAGEATFLLIATDNMQAADYPDTISSQYMIAYAGTPCSRADWHLRRYSAMQEPSPLEFTILFQKITQVYNTLPAPTHHLTAKEASPEDVAGTQKTSPPVITDNAHTTRPRFDWRERLKILIVGSVGSGKTTAIDTLSQTETIATEAKPSDHTQLSKPSTTVAMDFGTLSLDSETQLRIYGAPGQRRFDFMTDILLKNSLGLIILVSNELSDAFTELDYYLDANAVFLQNNPAVIGVTHNDLSPSPSLHEYNSFMQSRGHHWPVLKVDARKHDDMTMLVERLLALITHPVA